MTLLALRDVACVRGGRLVFEGVTAALPAGGALVVSGPNGAGKSSLIRLAAGLLRPAAGMVECGARVALLAEAAALDGERTLAQALGFWARAGGGRGGASEALDAVGLLALADVPVRLLSTGQRRRAAMARVAMSGAPLWLLDEPANGLDADGVRRVEALAAAHRAGGGAVVVATHLPLALPGAAQLALAA